MIGNDAFFSTEFCETEEDFYCFISGDISFAVPKLIEPTMKDWTVRGIRFELLERDASISVFGRKLDGLAVIRKSAPPPQGTYVYLYSARHGLVAFGLEDLRATHWLEGEVGFGSAPR